MTNSPIDGGEEAIPTDIPRAWASFRQATTPGEGLGSQSPRRSLAVLAPRPCSQVITSLAPLRVAASNGVNFSQTGSRFSAAPGRVGGDFATAGAADRRASGPSCFHVPRLEKSSTWNFRGWEVPMKNWS